MKITIDVDVAELPSRLKESQHGLGRSPSKGGSESWAIPSSARQQEEIGDECMYRKA